MKLRGRTTTAESAEGAQCLCARGANPQARHGPLQRLLDRPFILQLSNQRVELARVQSSFAIVLPAELQGTEAVLVRSKAAAGWLI